MSGSYDEIKNRFIRNYRSCNNKNKINNLKIVWTKKKSITIVLCAKGYPCNYIKNSEIKNLNNILIR